MNIQILHDKSIILSFLKRNPELQVYCIGDLDDFFWPKTIWYALVEDETILSIALLYSGMEIPTLLLFHADHAEYSKILLNRVKSILPDAFYAHLSPGLIDIFDRKNIIEDYGLTHKMALRKNPPVINDSNIRRLSVDDLPAILDLYTLAYPHNWFDKRMLETGKYFGYFKNQQMAGIAGIHVYSPQYRVAALGNITTHPDYRKRQIAYKLTAALCSDLFKSVDFIGLNVKSNNDFAIKCYTKLDFEIIGQYEEYYLKNV